SDLLLDLWPLGGFGVTRLLRAAGFLAGLFVADARGRCGVVAAGRRWRAGRLRPALGFGAPDLLGNGGGRGAAFAPCLGAWRFGLTGFVVVGEIEFQCLFDCGERRVVGVLASRTGSHLLPPRALLQNPLRPPAGHAKITPGRHALHNPRERGSTDMSADAS